jgi:threonylcarbamoyladenosine tRNA methylthiotransferase MtaB
MHRRYRPGHYEQKVAALIDAAGPELAIGADVMVGFPGETDSEFRETYDLVARLPLTYLHIFPFSPRPGTRGWELHHQTPVGSQAFAGRMRALQKLAAEKSRSFRAGFAGRTLPAITLHTPDRLADQGRTSALTDNYLSMEINEVVSANRLVDLRILGESPTGTLLGALDFEIRSQSRPADLIAQS